MNGIIRKQMARQPSLTDYLADPERYPTVSGRPFPDVNPMGAVGQAPDLASILAQPEDPLGPPLSLPNARDPRVHGMSVSALAVPAPPEPPAVQALPEQSGLEPASAPNMARTDLDAEWAAALQRARTARQRESGYGLQSPAVKAARGMMPAGMPPRPAPNPVIAALIDSPFGDFVNRQGAPGIARRQMQARAAIPPTRRAR